MQNLLAAERNKFDIQYNQKQENRKNETEFTHMVDEINRMWGFDHASGGEDTCMFLPFMLFWEELLEIRKDANEFVISQAEFNDSTKLKRKKVR